MGLVVDQELAECENLPRWPMRPEDRAANLSEPPTVIKAQPHPPSRATRQLADRGRDGDTYNKDPNVVECSLVHLKQWRGLAPATTSSPSSTALPPQSRGFDT